eukprot:7229754-Pyramimonas_sp.AAC.1
MEDARLMLVLNDVQDAVTDELLWLIHSPMSLWSDLGDVCNLEPEELRHRVLRSSMVAKAFMHHQLFKTTDRLPFSLVKGDLKTNLRNLKASDQPAEQ